MKKKSLSMLSLNKRAVSNLNTLNSIRGASAVDCNSKGVSVCEVCDPTTGIRDTSCKCSGGQQGCNHQ